MTDISDVGCGIKQKSAVSCGVYILIVAGWLLFSVFHSHGQISLSIYDVYLCPVRCAQRTRHSMNHQPGHLFHIVVRGGDGWGCRFYVKTTNV